MKTAEHAERERRKERLGANHSGISGSPAIFHARWWTAFVVARTTERPGANASPTSPCPATSKLALASGVIFTMPRLPESDAATYILPATSKAKPCGLPRPRQH